MRLSIAEVRRHRGRLLATASNARERWIERQGLIVTLRDESGCRGTGEASPLPGYSPDTIGGCADALANLDVSALRIDPDAPLAPQLARCSDALPSHYPAARFALECAVADLVGLRTAQPVWALLHPDSAENALRSPGHRLTALIDATTPAEAARTLAAAQTRGVTSFKLKIGRPQAFDREREITEALRVALGPTGVLRLDANRSFPPTEALRYLHELAGFRPEFVEEPTTDLNRVAESPVPIALDESLQTPGAEPRLQKWLETAPISTLVLKPMLLGGFSACLRWGEVARRLGLRVVISHLLGGPIALGACCQLALGLNSPSIPTGLDHHAGLHAWPATSISAMSSADLRWSADPGLGVRWRPGRVP